MSSVTLNDREFDIEEVHPLVVELRPTDGKTVPLLEWVQKDIAAIAEKARKCHILRVRNAVATAGMRAKPACAKSHASRSKWRGPPLCTEGFQRLPLSRSQIFTAFR